MLQITIKYWQNVPCSELY